MEQERERAGFARRICGFWNDPAGTPALPSNHTPYLSSKCNHFVPIVGGESALHVEIRGAEKLSYRERQVVVLKESGSSAAEIAGRLAISEATVATLYRRARAKGYQVVIVLDAGVLGLDDPDGSQLEA